MLGKRAKTDSERESTLQSTKYHLVQGGEAVVLIPEDKSPVQGNETIGVGEVDVSKPVCDVTWDAREFLAGSIPGVTYYGNSRARGWAHPSGPKSHQFKWSWCRPTSVEVKPAPVPSGTYVGYVEYQDLTSEVPARTTVVWGVSTGSTFSLQRAGLDDDFDHAPWVFSLGVRELDPKSFNVARPASLLEHKSAFSCESVRVVLYFLCGDE